MYRIHPWSDGMFVVTKNGAIVTDPIPHNEALEVRDVKQWRHDRGLD